MKNTTIRTLKALEKVVGKGKGLWFLAYVDARSFADSADRKDMARLFEEGLPPIKKRWKEVLGTIGWNENENEDAYPTTSQVLAVMKECGW